MTRIWRTLHPAAAAAAAATAETAAAAAADSDGEGGRAAEKLDAPSAPGNRRGRRPDQGRVGARVTSVAASAISSSLVPASRRPPPVGRVRFPVWSGRFWHSRSIMMYSYRQIFSKERERERRTRERERLETSRAEDSENEREKETETVGEKARERTRDRMRRYEI